MTSGNSTVSYYQGPGRQNAGPKLVTVKGYPAGNGYDMVTGVGTVNAQQLVGELAASR